MRSLKFSNYPVRLQPTTFNSPFIPSRPVTLNSFAAFGASDIPVDRYAPPGGDIYLQLAAKYGPVVAGQVYNAALDGDRGSMSRILGSAIPLSQPGGGSVQPALDESMSDAFFTQIYNDPLGAPIEQVNRVLTNTGNAVASSTGITKAITLVGIGALVWFVLAHNK